MTSKHIEKDKDGFLVNLKDWSPMVAEELAQAEDITLTPEHWEVLNALRDFYQKFDLSPAMRPLTRYLKVKLSDNLSGIKNYRATINNKWILMEYDAKKGQLVYDFNDNIITETKNNLKIIVTDNVGNSTTFETIFFRK